MGSNKQAKNVNNAYDQEYQYLTGRSMNPTPKSNPLLSNDTRSKVGLPQRPEETAPSSKGVFGDLYDDTWNRRSEADAKSNRAYDDAYGGYKDILNSPTGGYDPGRVAGIDSLSSDYLNFAHGNTVSDADRNRMRGGGVYDEFAKTGGYSDGDIANIRSRGNSGIPAFYQNLKNDMNRQNVASGGYNPGFGAQSAKLAREQAHAGQSAALDTELGIKDRVNTGRQWGAQGMTSSEGALQNLLSQNFISGRGGSSGLQMGLMQGMNDNKMNALSGIRGLRTDTPGESSMYNQMLMNILGMRGDQLQGLLGQKAAYNPNQSWFDKYGIPIIQGGATVAGGLLGGPPGAAAAHSATSGLGGKKQPQMPIYA